MMGIKGVSESSCGIFTSAKSPANTQIVPNFQSAIFRTKDEELEQKRAASRHGNGPTVSTESVMTWELRPLRVAV